MVSDPGPVTVHRADHVLPISSSAIVDGCVGVRDGRIVEVGPAAEVLGHHPTAELVEWSGVLLPGLVNAHTHLQYTSFADVGSVVHPDYTAWSVAFVDVYDARADEDWTAVANEGVDQMLGHGITCIADIVTDFEARDVLHDRGIPGVAYLELIGTDEAEWLGGEAERLRTAVVEGATSEFTTVGISPHAPYSLEEPVLSGMAAMARELGVRLHIHVAESDGEDEYYRTGTGSLAERLRVVSKRRLGILERGGAGMSAAELVHHLGLTGPDAHFAHGVYLDREGRALTARDGTLVALCPRSNRVVGIDTPPVADYLAEGIPFAVGTDSLSSSPSLDLMEDVALLRVLAIDAGYDHENLDRRLLTAATMGGATALGLGHQLGSLESGKRADLAVFDVRAGDRTIERALVEDGAGSCVGTVLGGQLVGMKG